MNDTITTVVGNVVDSPRRVTLQDSAVTNFRMASTARRYDSATQEFVDAGTFWVDVECWNGLSSNVSASISKGDPVIVHGAITTHSWESDNGRRSTPRIRAFAVGPNLVRGTALFKRDRSGRPAEPADGATSEAESSAPNGAPDEEQLAQELGGDLTGEDYGSGSQALYEVDSENSSREPAHV
jgi:single-strand DNA-binding protein